VLLGEVFAESEAPNTAAHRGDQSLEFVVVGKVPRFLAVGQVLAVVAAGYAYASPGLAQVS